MALTGGGGAGNVAGSNPSGTGGSLYYIGNHVYALSGAVAVNNVETTLAEFETQNAYIDAKFQFSYMTHSDKDYMYFIYYNDEIVWSTTLAVLGASGGSLFNLAQLIIASHTKVKCTAENKTDSASIDQGVTISGEVYQ